MDRKPPNDYEPICSPKEIAALWQTTANNIRRTYVTNPDKKLQHKMIDMGAYCVANNLDGKMLQYFVEHRDEFIRVFHKISPEELDRFKRFQRFELFEEADK